MGISDPTTFSFRDKQFALSIGASRLPDVLPLTLLDSPEAAHENPLPYYNMWIYLTSGTGNFFDAKYGTIHHTKLGKITAMLFF
jgi:hypothetical protein